MDVKIDERRVAAFDGTRIAYQAAGDGPAVVLANGLGGNVVAWKFVFERLVGRHRVISWDYRGLFGSEPPRSGVLGPKVEVDDLLAVLEAEGVGRFAMIGWSMGAQVALETVRRCPERVVGLGIINGVAGFPLRKALPWPVLRPLLPVVFRLMRLLPPGTNAVAARIARQPAFLPVLQRLGFVGPTLDAGVFMEVVRHWMGMDYDLYGRTMAVLAEHDAEDVLAGVGVPTTIITGTNDLMTPVPTARALAAAIPGARLVLIEGGTHYTPVEFPEQVGAAIDELLAASGVAAGSW